MQPYNNKQKDIEEQTVPLSTISPLDGSVGPCGALSWGLQSLVNTFQGCRHYVHICAFIPVRSRQKHNTQTLTKQNARDPLD